jgi:hypothetical protein
MKTLGYIFMGLGIIMGSAVGTLVALIMLVRIFF